MTWYAEGHLKTKNLMYGYLDDPETHYTEESVIWILEEPNKR